MNTKIVKLDINRNLYDTLTAKQGDTQSRFLLFQLLDGAIPFSLENRSVKVFATKPDGKEVFNDLIINDRVKGYCTLELTNQMLAVPGLLKLELMVIEGDKKLTTNVFYMDVKKSINSENAIVSTNEFSALLNGLASLNEYDNYKNEIAAARDGEVNLLTKVKKIDEQLEQNMNMKSILTEKTANTGIIARPMVTFITDDGQLTDYTVFYEKIFKVAGVPCTTPLITDNISKEKVFITWEQAKELKEAGWTVCSHSANHINATASTEDEMHESFGRAKKALIEHNLDDDIYIAPFGCINPTIEKVAREYYDNLFATGNKFINNVEDPVTGLGKMDYMSNYKIWRRYGIGETYNDVAITKEDMKADIDYAYENNLWLVFVQHSHYDAFKDGNTGVADMLEVIQYAKDKGMDIVNARDGFNANKNIIDIGQADSNGKFLRINNEGEIIKNEIRVVNDGTTHNSHFAKIAELDYYYATSKDFGIEFDMFTTNNEKEGYQAHVKCEFRLSSFGPTPTFTTAKVNYNFLRHSKSDKYVSVSVVVEEAFERHLRLGVYITPNRNYTTIFIKNMESYSEEKDRLALTKVYNPQFVEALPSQNITSNSLVYQMPFEYSKAPDFAAMCVGHTVIDSTNKTIYVAYATGYNKWIKLEKASIITNTTFTPTIAGTTTQGTVTYTEQTGKYWLSNNICHFEIRLKGTLGSDLVGDLVIGLPASINGLTCANIGYFSGFGTENRVTNVYGQGKTLILNGTNSDGNNFSIKGENVPGKTFNLWLSGSFISY
jgi:hypothetical protein|nr:MAG TPA: Baseplate component [Caudoviricetes sp.]